MVGAGCTMRHFTALILANSTSFEAAVAPLKRNATRRPYRKGSASIVDRPPNFTRCSSVVKRVEPLATLSRRQQATLPAYALLIEGECSELLVHSPLVTGVIDVS